jgi:hypothetical protein
LKEKEELLSIALPKLVELETRINNIPSIPNSLLAQNSTPAEKKKIKNRRII